MSAGETRRRRCTISRRSVISLQLAITAFIVSLIVGSTLHTSLNLSVDIAENRAYNNELETSSEVTIEDARKARKEVLEILQAANVTDELDLEATLRLPTWKQITKLYGEGPVVYGLETCEQFQRNVPPNKRFLAVAGLFNTGTNTLATLLSKNCRLPQNPFGGIRPQVPWSKHGLASRKWSKTVKSAMNINKTHVLPAVMVRDPYSWFQSMCRNPYTARWHHSTQHCPNLVPNRFDHLLGIIKTWKTVPVRVQFDPGEKFKDMARWDSLAHLYDDWNQQYYKADFPRLMLRFEDLLFHIEETVRIVCNCAGGEPKTQNFTYVAKAAKGGVGHKKEQNNLIKAIMKYGTDKDRFTNMTRADIELAYNVVDKNFMNIFQYEQPRLP